ncbi:MAG: hypothetical protein JKY37_22905 [Nannocystaceae bacterium]|nr:hypothetical protein [Nannocystaceae bacterium]
MSSAIPQPIDLRLPRTFLCLAIGLLGAALGSIAGAILQTYAADPVQGPHLVWAAGVSTALTSILVTNWMIRRGVSARRGVVGVVVLGYSLAAVPASGLTLLVFCALKGELSPLFLIVGGLFGLALAPLGTVLGVACLPVLRAYERLRRNPSHVGRFTLCVGVGAWLIGTGSLALLLASEPVAQGLAWVGVGLGAVVVAVAGTMQVRRVRWFARVAARRVTGWTVCEFRDVHVPIGLARWSAVPDSRGDKPGVLCRVLGDAALEPCLRIPAAMLR